MRRKTVEKAEALERSSGSARTEALERIKGEIPRLPNFKPPPSTPQPNFEDQLMGANTSEASRETDKKNDFLCSSSLQRQDTIVTLLAH